MAQTAVQTAEMALSSTNQMKQMVQQLQTKDTEFEKDIADIKEQLCKSTTTKPEPFGSRELQVIVGGLKETQDENDIIDQVKKVVDGMGANGKYERIGTFVDPSKIGVVQFKSVASKIGFLRRTNSMETKWTNGENMRFKNNEPIEKQIADKKLVFVKYYLHETKGHTLGNINIKWKKNTVELEGKRVAWMTETGELQYDESVMNIKTVVDASMSEWLAKRGLE